MKHVYRFNEGKFGWSYPPGASMDPNAPYNQDDYIYEIGSEILYDKLIEKGFNEEEAENIVDNFINDDIYIDLIEKYEESPEIGWDDETYSPIYSDTYKELKKEAEKKYPKDYRLQKGYIQKELFKITLDNICMSPEFNEWLKNNGYIFEKVRIKRFFDIK